MGIKGKMQRVAKHEIDFTTGSLFKKLIIVAIPLILTNVMQMLFNAADVAVVGIFDGDDAVAAVGANTALINVIINLFVGFGAGASVVLARYVGQNDLSRARKLVGTSILLSIVIGIALTFVGVFGARTFLTWMNCDARILDKAVLYLQIYFIGMPIIMLYNFSAGLLRAVGDTLRPMIFLIISGVVNVGLNVFFVVVFHLSVAGVAIATVVSQAISAVLALIIMVKGDGFSKLTFKNLRIYKSELKEIIKVGLPSGIQASMFSISNVLIQSTVNTFLKVGTTANAVAHQFDGFVAMTGNGVALASMSVISQNYGAKNFKRIKRAIWQGVATAVVADVFVGALIMIFAVPLCMIMTKDPAVIELAVVRMNILCSGFCIGCIMDVLTYSLRALGKSTTAMVVSIIFVCLFRILWLNTFYKLNPTFAMIYYSYPISWALSIIADVALLIPLIRKLKRREEKNAC